jgi:hypothetical protein
MVAARAPARAPASVAAKTAARRVREVILVSLNG